MGEFEGKVVLVTGAGRGSGRSIALEFARAGAVVAVNDLTPVNLDETMKELISGGGKGRAYLFDVAKLLPVQAMIDQVLQDWGRIDILIHHAQVRPRTPLLSIDEWEWHRTMDVNLGGAFFSTQVAGHAMREQGGGRIVYLVSAGEEGAGGSAAYLASKYGLLALTRIAAQELGPSGICVNAVCGGECTGWFEQETGGVLNLPIVQTQYLTISQAVLWLCGEERSSIYGSLVLVSPLKGGSNSLGLSIL